MQDMKGRLEQSRTAFFEEVRTLNEAYVLSHGASSQKDEDTPTDEILAALALVLGYTHLPCADSSASG